MCRVNIIKVLHWRHNGRNGVSNHQFCGCSLNRFFRRRSKKTPKLRVIGLCEGNSPGTGEFPAQMASNAENVSIWWRHHECWVRYSQPYCTSYTLRQWIHTECGNILWSNFIHPSVMIIGIHYLSADVSHMTHYRWVKPNYSYSMPDKIRPGFCSALFCGFFILVLSEIIGSISPYRSGLLHWRWAVVLLSQFLWNNLEVYVLKRPSLDHHRVYYSCNV